MFALPESGVILSKVFVRISVIDSFFRRLLCEFFAVTLAVLSVLRRSNLIEVRGLVNKSASHRVSAVHGSVPECWAKVNFAKLVRIDKSN